jgi:transcriptional regulator GlxA family with amidase domain
MQRRSFLVGSAAAAASFAARRVAGLPSATTPIAFPIGEHVNVIDMAGPWEVFQDVMLPNGEESPFELFTVGPSKAPLAATGGLTLVPHYSYSDAPRAAIVVVPAHHSSAATLEWLRTAARRADLVMSVCTGAFIVARTGLLDGLTATTHHEFHDSFAREFPKVKLERGVRYVEHEKVATAGGLTSGIDLALRVVERYHGAEIARATATYLEYQSRV